MSADELKHPGINLGATDPDSHEAAEEVVFGFMVFLMSDLVIFSLLFAVFASMVADPGSRAGGPGGRQLFDLGSIAAQTGLLLASSFTFGMASLAMKYTARPRALQGWLGVTVLLGAGFLALELHDFLHMIAIGAGPSRSGYLSAFFALVPTHGLHVLAGSLWMILTMVQLRLWGLTRRMKIRILCLGLFWHLLDIVWVGIFSVVYLRGLA